MRCEICGKEDISKTDEWRKHIRIMNNDGIAKEIYYHYYCMKNLEVKQ